MKMIRRMMTVAALAALMACSKPEEPAAPAQESPAPAPAKKAEPVKSTKPASPTVAKPVAPKPVAPAISQTTLRPAQPPVFAPEPTPKEVLQQLNTLETAYTANPDFTKRVETLYKISDIGTPESVTVLGRLFQSERDPHLKTELVDSLADIDGLEDRKLAILTAAAGADQPKEVRETAIDGLGDLEAKYSLPILQALASDADEDIREQAKDMIEMVKAEEALLPKH